MLNSQDSWFDDTIVEDLWFVEASWYLKAKFWQDTADEYQELLLHWETRVALFHYKDSIAVAYNPYALPVKKEWLQMISYPKVTNEQMEILRNWSWEKVQKLLQNLWNIN